MPPSTIADAANTSARTTRPSWRRPGERAPHRRMVEPFRLGQPRPARHDAGDDADDRDADPDDAPRRAEPQRDAGHRRADHAPAVEEPVETDEPARVVRRARRPRRCSSPRRRDRRPPSPASARARRTRDAGPRASSVSSAPHTTSASVNERPGAEAVGDGAADRGHRGGRDDPRREQRTRGRVSVRRKVRSMSTVATAQPPAKKPNTTKATATGRRLGGRGLGGR